MTIDGFREIIKTKTSKLISENKNLGSIHKIIDSLCHKFATQLGDKNNKITKTNINKELNKLLKEENHE